MARSQDDRVARIIARLDGKLPPYVVRPRDTWQERRRQPQRPVTIAWALARPRHRQTDHSATERILRLCAEQRRANRARRARARASQRRNRGRS